MNSYLFFGCKSLNKVVLNPALKYIGEGVFCHCDNICEIELPSTIENVYSDAFDQNMKVIINK